MDHDHEFAELFRANATSIGRPESDDGVSTFSTDMGNVSLAVPSIHPCLAIETGGAVNHQPEFTEAAINPSADRAVSEGALAMAWTVDRRRDRPAPRPPPERDAQKPASRPRNRRPRHSRHRQSTVAAASGR